MPKLKYFYHNPPAYLCVKTLSVCLMAPFSHPFGESDRWIEVGRFATTIGPRDFGSISLGELGKFGRSRWGPRFFGQFLLGGDFGQEKWQGPRGFVGFVSILLNIFTPVLGEMIQVDSYCLTGLKQPIGFKFQDVSR